MNKLLCVLLLLGSGALAKFEVDPEEVIRLLRMRYGATYDYMAEQTKDQGKCYETFHAMAVLDLIEDMVSAINCMEDQFDDIEMELHQASSKLTALIKSAAPEFGNHLNNVVEEFIDEDIPEALVKLRKLIVFFGRELGKGMNDIYTFLTAVGDIIDDADKTTCVVDSVVTGYLRLIRHLESLRRCSNTNES